MIVPDEILNFTFKDMYHGFAECHGNLSLDENSITIEYFVKDSIIGFFKSNIKRVKIKYSEIINTEIKKKFFRRYYLIIRIKSLNNIIDLPFIDENAKLSIKISKSSLLTAEEISSYINYRVAENKLSKIDNNY
ncbi:MAG: hypothetical protein WHV28_09130 [Bacteroidota bacterium]